MSINLINLKLRVLSDISRIVDRALELDQALSEVLRILSETLSMKRAAITLVDREIGRLVIAASHGLSEEERGRGVYALDEGVTGLVFRTAKPFCVPDVRREPLFLDKTGARKIEKGRVSFIGVPVVLHNRPMGVLTVDRLFGDEADFEEDVEFLSVVSTLIAQFISLNEQVRERVQNLTRENVSLKYRLSRGDPGRYIVGRSLAMLEVQRQLEKVAPTRATVLLLGESGVGKTLIARIIHDLSDRRDRPFVKVNCAALPENLLESELFGYEKGAFTGAVGSRSGRFEDAHGGSIFLDEIGELPLGLQAKLLRVLQEREFERLGSNETRRVDVRILAASNKDLVGLIDKGLFREDLYYRLNVFPIWAPALRDRKEDLTRLLNHFLKKVSRDYNRRLYFTPEALRLLKEYDWPGNVREMENLIERLVILTDGEKIDPTLIEPYLAPSRRPSPPGHPSGEKPGDRRGDPAKPKLRDMEMDRILSALRRHDWVQRRACRELGITQRQLGYRLKKYGLEAEAAAERAKARFRK
ncbi:MAG: sigma 54-interacting transcriptional regulator [Pseudomonadota bacterium]